LIFTFFMLADYHRCSSMTIAPNFKLTHYPPPAGARGGWASPTFRFVFMLSPLHYTASRITPFHDSSHARSHALTYGPISNSA
jgi:hypothetical protein